MGVRAGLHFVVHYAGWHQCQPQALLVTRSRLAGQLQAARLDPPDQPTVEGDAKQLNGLGPLLVILAAGGVWGVGWGGVTM